MKSVSVIASLVTAFGLSMASAQTTEVQENSLIDEDEYVTEDVWELAASNSEMVLCANEPVPSGWVVERITAGCGTGVGLHYLRKLDPNRSSQTMCAVTGVPAGWIVNNIRGGCLSGIPQYEIVYAKKGYSYRMCRVPGSFIPTGWVVNLITTGCSLPGYQYWEIYWPDPATGTTRDVCGVAPVPAGWTKVSSRAGCYSSNGLITIKYMQ